MGQSAATYVKRYLDALAGPPRRQRSIRGADTVREQLNAVQAEIAATSNVIARLQLYQRAVGLEQKLIDIEAPAEDFAVVEAAFVEHVADWASARGITYDALRRAGVSPRILREAGMKPG